MLGDAFACDRYRRELIATSFGILKKVRLTPSFDPVKRVYIRLKAIIQEEVTNRAISTTEAVFTAGLYTSTTLSDRIAARGRRLPTKRKMSFASSSTSSFRSCIGHSRHISSRRANNPSSSSSIRSESAIPPSTSSPYSSSSPTAES